ncbi:hypothetical protein A1O1_02804 [Capronia coronata CBS 617.96]|uniref:Clavaminate synthase-like protein n=1 Tax=Capronia coronata CBS 617.96 TaxID=1182541 RepID=W9YXM0_9EURO|nr:uncharacterized protein A1O1_02804 [Capronia coronata CBS 617.96]EXJ94410.1 hypothetical protein A1O1_02804 [Capronia coronata CBS 617.96]
MAVKHATPVTVSLADLGSNTVSAATLTQAFGPDSLGILVVRDLSPAFLQLRRRVLLNASHLAALPSTTLLRLRNPDAKYLVGWSHGVETLSPGTIDTSKGSYYINCAFYQDPTLNGADGMKFPGFEEYTAANIWPNDVDIPGFRSDAEKLISLIIDTAVLVARACDRFASAEIEGYEAGYLERVVKQSQTTKARLLHYFPIEHAGINGHPNGVNDSMAEETQKEENGVDDYWCTTHLDHGCLTGLTNAMFIDESSAELLELPTPPDPTSGLYIQSRSGKVHKVTIPEDCLAFQTGEALELITQGKFKAVPHFVKGVNPMSCTPGSRIARNTLAVFTQPNLDEPVDLVSGLNFGEFARGVVKKNTVH